MSCRLAASRAWLYSTSKFSKATNSSPFSSTRRSQQGRSDHDQPHRAARLIAAMFMASAAYTVFPLVPSALVEHTIKLMRTDQQFLQDAGMLRLQWLARFEPVRRRARELGAVEAVEGLDRRDDKAWEAQRRTLLKSLRLEDDGSVSTGGVER